MKHLLRGPWCIKIDESISGPHSLFQILNISDETNALISDYRNDDWSHLLDFKKEYLRSIVSYFETCIWDERQGVKVAQVDEEQLALAIEKAEQLIGLQRAKNELRQAIALIKVNQKRARAGLSGSIGSFNATFCGSPGTGKTTFARIYAEALTALGVSQHASIVEVTRSDLVAAYVGQTAIKTREVIQRSLGGVLFIDEAYSLLNDKDDNYGQEALAELVKGMEDHRENLVVVLAGYTSEMRTLLEANPGLKSRILSEVHFDDFSTPELLRIIAHMAGSRNYNISESALPHLTKHFESLRQSRGDRTFGNAREARNVLDRMIRSHAMRMMGSKNSTTAELSSLTMEDLS